MKSKLDLQEKKGMTKELDFTGEGIDITEDTRIIVNGKVFIAEEKIEEIKIKAKIKELKDWIKDFDFNGEDKDLPCYINARGMELRMKDLYKLLKNKQ